MIPIEKLENSLRKNQIVTNPVELITYEYDATNTRGKPQAVLFPENSSDLQKILRWADEHNVPIIPRGAGTGLSGGAIAESGGVIVESSRLNKILSLDVIGRSVIVEPGVVNLVLDEYVKTSDLYYPPDPASGRSATLGGNIAENAGGPHCFKYGVTTNYITGLDVVMPDGQLLRFGGEAYDYPEYDLCGLLTGSEGTLGIVACAYARLLRNPPAVKTLMAAFDNVEDAGNAVSAMIVRGLVPSTMEMMDQKLMGIIEDYVHAGLPIEAGAALIIEVDGYPESLDAQMTEVTEALSSNKAWGLRLAKTSEERDLIWYGRKSAVGAMARLSPAYLLLDGTVPRSKLAQALSSINQVCNQLNLTVAYVFHAGDGNLHPFILIPDLNDPVLLDKVHQAGKKVIETCLALGGSITGEHGVGIEKRAFLPLMYQDVEIKLMQSIKDIFDPQHLLNPGKIFPVSQVKDDQAPQKLVGDNHVDTIDGNILHEPGMMEINAADLYVTVNACTSLEQLQSKLNQQHMWVPVVSPWPERKLVDIVSSNFNAPMRMRYGALRDLILEMNVQLADGQIVHFGRPVVKNVAGYDLCKLFIGDYGTLGKIVDLSLKLVPMPATCKTYVIPVNNLIEGVTLASKLLRVCLVASSLLLCKPAPKNYDDTPYAILYTAEGISLDVDAELSQVGAIVEASGGQPVFLLEQTSGNEMWANWLKSHIPDITSGQTPAIVCRIGIPPKHVQNYLTSQADILDQGSFYADIANGLIYTQGVQMPGIRQSALALGGYAIILAASEYLPSAERLGYQPQSLTLMKQLKLLFDPVNVMNPGGFIV